MENFSFGSTSGSVFAFYFFLLLALFIGFGVYRLLQEPRLKRLLRPSMPRWQGVVIGAGVAIVVFLGIYFSALDGFYRLEVQQNGEEIRLDYILPQRTLIFKRSDIAEARRLPSYKSLWQLVLYTPSGAQFTSARGGYADVRKAWDYLNAHLDSPKKAE